MSDFTNILGHSKSSRSNGTSDDGPPLPLQRPMLSRNRSRSLSPSPSAKRRQQLVQKLGLHQQMSDPNVPQINVINTGSMAYNSSDARIASSYGLSQPALMRHKSRSLSPTKRKIPGGVLDKAKHYILRFHLHRMLFMYFYFNHIVFLSSISHLLHSEVVQMLNFMFILCRPRTRRRWSQWTTFDSRQQWNGARASIL